MTPFLKKFGIPVLLAFIGVSGAFVIYSVKTTPGGKTPAQIAAEQPLPPQENQNELISNTQLQINSLLENNKTTNENVSKIFNNQEALNKAFKQFREQNEAQQKTIKDQRAYIAMLYQKVLDLELKFESLGGGMSGLRKTRPQTTRSNPLEGTDYLPSMNPDGILPPLPE